MGNGIVRRWYLRKTLGLLLRRRLPWMQTWQWN